MHQVLDGPLIVLTQPTMTTLVTTLATVTTVKTVTSPMAVRTGKLEQCQQ